LPSPELTPPRALAFVWPVQLCLLVLTALLTLGFHLRLPGRLPSGADHAAAGAHLASHARSGDVLLLFPWWTERARLHAPPDLPVVGYLGSEADPLTAHPRIWVLEQPRLPKADRDAFHDAFLSGRTPVGDPVAFGPLRLSLYENARHRPARLTASDAVARGLAEVFLEQPDGRRTPCPRTGDRYRCPGPPHLYVRTEWHEVFYEPRRCVYAHPPGGEMRLVISLPGTAAAGEALLEAGILWEHAVKRHRITPTYVRLEAAEAAGALSDLALPPGREGFARDAVQLPAAQDEAAGGLRITVQSQSPESRQVCLDLTVFDPAGGEK
jgi:hypothetical protein